jgi:hypothetical protein
MVELQRPDLISTKYLPRPYFFCTGPFLTFSCFKSWMLETELLKHIEILRKGRNANAISKVKDKGNGSFDVHHESYQSRIHYAVLWFETSPR